MQRVLDGLHRAGIKVILGTPTQQNGVWTVMTGVVGTVNNQPTLQSSETINMTLSKVSLVDNTDCTPASGWSWAAARSAVATLMLKASMTCPLVVGSVYNDDNKPPYDLPGGRSTPYDASGACRLLQPYRRLGSFHGRPDIWNIPWPWQEQVDAASRMLPCR